MNSFIEKLLKAKYPDLKHGVKLVATQGSEIVVTFTNGSKRKFDISLTVKS